MGFNAYKEFAKIKDSLNNKGLVDKIPMDAFIIELMIALGTGKKKADEWLSNYQHVGFIKLEKDQNKDNAWFVIILKDKQK